MLFCWGFYWFCYNLIPFLSNYQYFFKQDTSLCSFSFSEHRSLTKLLLKLTLGGSPKSACFLSQYFSSEMKLDLQSLTIWFWERQLKQSLFTFVNCLLSEILLTLKLGQSIIFKKHFKLWLYSVISPYIVHITGHFGYIKTLNLLFF